MTGSDIERFTHGNAVGVDVGAIERDLASLWRQASQADASVTRACSWNLVVAVSSDQERERARGLVEALVAQVPSRTLILDHRPGAPGPELEAYVTANCRLNPGGGKMVCTEEITIEARGRGGELLPSLLRALLVPDINSAVMWADVPHRSSVLEDLLQGVERVVLDSTRATELTPVQRLGPKVIGRVADLNWLRGANLRRVVAGAFDGPAEAPMLLKLKAVKVRCGPEALAAAKLLVGWLGARLSWGPPERADDDPARLGWRVGRAQGSVLVDLEPDPALTGLAELAFEAEGGHWVRLAAQAGGMALSASGSPARAVPCWERPDDALVVAALGSRGADRLYQAALGRAVELER